MNNQVKLRLKLTLNETSKLKSGFADSHKTQPYRLYAREPKQRAERG